MVNKTQLKKSPMGQALFQLDKELYTPKEIAESDRRVAIIGEQIKARDERAGNNVII